MINNKNLTGYWNFVTDFKYEMYRSEGILDPNGLELPKVDYLFESKYSTENFNKGVTWFTPRIVTLVLGNKPMNRINSPSQIVRIRFPYRSYKGIIHLNRFEDKSHSPSIIFKKNKFYYSEKLVKKKEKFLLHYNGFINKDNSVFMKKLLVSRLKGYQIETHIAISLFCGIFDPQTISFEVECQQEQYNLLDKYTVSLNYKFIRPYKMFFWLADKTIYDRVKKQ